VRQAQADLYLDLDTIPGTCAPHSLNRRLDQRARAGARVANMSSIWTVLYTQPACYNWLFQHYLRLEGLALSWVGTGRIIFSLNFTENDFDAVSERFVRAAQAMQEDGWWWPSGLGNKDIKRRVLREMVLAKLPFGINRQA
jgi:glutamate-1-semialdehyde 2,1-aminomutase